MTARTGSFNYVDRPWQDWEARPAFKTKDESRRVHPFYALGANGERYEGGTIHVHDVEVALEDIGHPPGMRHRIGYLTWNRRTIQYVEVDEAWQRQGIATELLRLAREVEPHLRHAPCANRSESGEAFVRATDPDEACPDDEVSQ